jgi:hypothetical protein
LSNNLFASSCDNYIRSFMVEPNGIAIDYMNVVRIDLLGYRWGREDAVSGQAELAGSLEVDRQIELGWQLHRQVGRFGACRIRCT